MRRALAIARAEFLIVRRNRWVFMATLIMVLFALALTFAGSAPTGSLGVDMLTVSVASMTTLSVYLAPLLALMMAFDSIAGEAERAFCLVRPPGHHALKQASMGFCLFNNIAVGAAHAMEEHDLKKIAVLDFDVHQGNGTEEIFADDSRVLFCSTFQHPFYPFTPVPPNSANRVNVPLDATAKSAEFRSAVTDRWLPALDRFGPEIVFVSAGFDAHRDDD